MEIRDYIDKNFNRFVEEWNSLIRIQSISAKPENAAEMVKCAERWVELLLAAGADSAKVMKTKGNPIVFAQKMVSPELPTVLV